MNLGPMIRAARKRAGHKTIYSMAKATGLSSGQLSELEAGKYSPSVDTLEKIFAAINWEVAVTFRPRRS